MLYIGGNGMEILKDRYSITELSERLNTTDHTLRYYQKEFGIEVPKDDRGRRYYTTELANLMFKIKTMRNQGLQIKAIRKILNEDISLKEPPPVIPENEEISPAILKLEDSSSREIKRFFDDFKEQITLNVSKEVNSFKDYLSSEIYKSKLEIGACVENSVRKLENKMEKHFLDVDRSIGLWRERNKKSAFKRILSKLKL